MKLPFWSKKILSTLALMLICGVGFADDQLFRQARAFQREGEYDKAIAAFKHLSLHPRLR